jgi:beta-N-acetylhexosaminidase
VADSSIEELCGQLVVGGFEGTALPESFAEALARGQRAGVILFKRNLGEVEQLTELLSGVIASAARPPFVAVDQEGGRVVRLGAPFTVLPPMRVLGAIDDVDLTRRAAAQMGRELRAAGFNLDFAPVMDVDTNPANPVIGDRAFGRDPRTVMKHGVACIRGLQQEGVLACAKHFPGHGDTLLDSHLSLPVVEHPLTRLRQIELPPFRAASGAGVASMMSAHVVYPALDADVPATFSRAIATGLLRDDIGFEGVLFSDDLEMGAVTQHREIGAAAVEAVMAGCDVLLVCKSEERQARVLEALVERAESDARFLERCRVAAERSLRVRTLCPARVDPSALRMLGNAELSVEIARRAEEAPPSGPRKREELA